MKLEEWGLVVVLALCGVCDCKKRMIPVWLPGAYMAGILGMTLFQGGWLNMAAGMLPGLLLCLVSWVSKGRIGMGDGIVMTAVGAGTGLWMSLSVMFWGFIAATLYGFARIMRGKGTRKTEYPLVPFLFLAYVGMLAAGFG